MAWISVSAAFQANGNGITNLPPSREVPFIGKIAALPGLHRINSAVIAGQEDTGTVRLLEK